MAEEHPDPEAPRPPPAQLATWSLIGFALLAVIGLMMVRLEHTPTSSRSYPRRALIADAAARLLPPPPMDDEYFPCGDCHIDELPNPERREFEDEHETMDFRHGDLWCLHCHDLEDREKLHLADGTLIEMEASWQLCTQCHSKKLADWRAGVHGKRTGHWRGAKDYRTCVSCHNPHRPPFQPLEPEPPPLRPTQITVNGNISAEAVHEQ